MTVEPRQVAQVIRVAESIEGRTTASPSGALLLTAISGALLREIIGARSTLPEGVVWIAVSCTPLEAASWLAVDGRADPEALEGRSQPASFEPGFLGRVFGNAPDLIRPNRARPMLRDVSAEIGGSGTFLGCDRALCRSSDLGVPLRQQTLSISWLVGVDRQLPGEAQARLDGLLGRTESILADRLNFGIGNYKPIAAALASVDDEFHLALLRAREADGLADVLDSLIAGTYEARDQRNRPGDTAPGEDAEQPGPPPELSAATVRQAIVATFGVDPSSVLLYMDEDEPVASKFGWWTALAEIPYGLARLRTRTVLVQACATEIDVHSALARYLEESERQSSALTLMVFCSSHPAGRVGRYSEVWRAVGSVYFHDMS